MKSFSKRMDNVSVTVTLKGRKQWARDDEMEAQRGARPSPNNSLQKALGPEPSDWIYDWHRFSPENPASHRKANCRITKMHHSHRHPQIAQSDLSGEEHQNLTAQYQSGGIRTRHIRASKVARK